MRKAYREEHGKDIELGTTTSALVGRSYGKGEGADDVTGQRLPTGTGVDNDTDEDGATLGGSRGDFDALNAPGLVKSSMDLDLDAYLQGQQMHYGNEYHFARSPEWFFDLNEWATFGASGSGNNDFSLQESYM